MLPKVKRLAGKNANYLLFDTDDYITKKLFERGVWEEYLFTIAMAYLEGVASPLVVDVGANLGTFSIPVAKAIDARRGIVYAFEPQRIIYYQLCGNIIENRLDNCVALQNAVGEKDDTILIPELNYATSPNNGAFSINQTFRENLGLEAHIVSGSAKPVKLTRLDSVQFDTRLSLLKIDSEGYELNVLKGATSILEASRFPPILLEAWQKDWFKQEREQLFDYIAYLGYKIIFNYREEYVAEHPRHGTRVEIALLNNEVVSAKRML